MTTLKKIVLIAILLGIIIGIVGKIIFSGIALIYFKPINLTLKGIIQLFIISAIFGLFGGLIRYIVFFVLKKSSFLRGIFTGLIMFAISITFLFIKERHISFDYLPTFIAAALLYLLFGLLLERFLNKKID